MRYTQWRSSSHGQDFRTRTVPSLAVRQRGEHSWGWSGEGLIWRQVSQIPRSYHEHEAVGWSTSVYSKGYFWSWFRTGEKTLRQLSFQETRLSQFPAYTTELAEKVEQDLSQRPSAETDQMMWLRRTWLCLRPSFIRVIILQATLLQQQRLCNTDKTHSAVAGAVLAR